MQDLSNISLRVFAILTLSVKYFVPYEDSFLLPPSTAPISVFAIAAVMIASILCPLD
jgi:hypothetical protein